MTGSSRLRRNVVLSSSELGSPSCLRSAAAGRGKTSPVTEQSVTCNTGACSRNLLQRLAAALFYSCDSPIQQLHLWLSPSESAAVTEISMLGQMKLIFIFIERLTNRFRDASARGLLWALRHLSSCTSHSDASGASRRCRQPLPGLTCKLSPAGLPAPYTTGGAEGCLHKYSAHPQSLSLDQLRGSLVLPILVVLTHSQKTLDPPKRQRLKAS